MTQAQSIPASAGSNPAQVIDLSDANLDPLLKLVLTQLDDDQAQDIVTIDLKGKSSIADHMVIASGRSTRQVAAIAQKLAEKIKQAGAEIEQWYADHCHEHMDCASISTADLGLSR